jgi:hypothetical protein
MVLRPKWVRQLAQGGRGVLDKEAGMFRRRFGLVRRPFLGRRRLFGAALIGGLGFAAGRASKPADPQNPEPSPEVAARLQQLSELHATGELTDQEFTAAKSRLLEL